MVRGAKTRGVISMIGEEYKAGMVDVASMAGMHEEDDSEAMVPVIGTAGMANWQGRASRAVAAAVGAGRWEGQSNANS
jgi:hypothetical protein